MKFIKISLICLATIITQPSLCNDLFDEFDQEMESFESPDTDQIIKEYISFVHDYLTEYDQWRKSYLNDYDKKQEKIINRWGASIADNAGNVEYSKDLSSRTIVDYQNNEVVIEILVPIDTSSTEANELLTKEVEKNLLKEEQNAFENELPAKINSEKIVVTPVEFNKKDEEIAKQNIKLQTTAYKNEADLKSDELSRNIAVIPYEVVEDATVIQQESLEKEQAERIKKVEKQYQVLRQTEPKPQRKILKYTVQLPANSLGKRAEKYSPFAEKESKRFDIPVALIMAIMHSESAFNPKAKSAVPAYGLMQIVPRTAGHDVNKLVRLIDKPMKPVELYVPEVNVETGSAYLNILDQRYLKSIKDPESRLYCTIAAYNTGAGNVAKVFNKKGEGNTRNINRAAKIINQLSPSEVYQALMERLPYDETKNYLKKVSKRISLYQVHNAT